MLFSSPKSSEFGTWKTDSGSMDSNTPQLPPSETESQSMDSTTPVQLRPSETESRSMDSSTQPNFNLQQPPPWTSEAGGSSQSMGGTSTSTPPQLLQNLINILQEVKLMKHPPLGLKLEKTPEFLNSFWNWRLAWATGKPVGQPPEKLGNKASKIPATSISIGPNWRKESIREDHLMLKFYFKKKKLIWEFLEGPLKEKIEVSWSDITAMDAHVPHNKPGSLQIQLGNKPSFFRETPPQPGKHTHTNWEKTTDFTHGQAASRHGIHEAKFAQGLLDAHYAMLILSDQRLLELTINPFPAYHGDSASTTAPCLPSQTLSLSLNNPTPISTPPSASASASQSNLNPTPFTAVDVGVGERSFHMQGESSRYANHHQTPLLMPSQQLPFSFNTGVEQTLPFNYPTPSIPASDQYLNPAMTTVVSSRRIGERSFHMQGESSSSRIKADHHNSSHDQARLFSDSTLLAIYSQPLAEEREYCDFMTEFNQFQNINHSHHINGHQPSTMESIAAHDHNQNNNNNSAARAALGSNNNIYGGEQWPQLDGDGNNNTGINDSMDLYSIIRSTNINRRPPT